VHKKGALSAWDAIDSACKDRRSPTDDLNLSPRHLIATAFIATAFIATALYRHGLYRHGLYRHGLYRHGLYRHGVLSPRHFIATALRKARSLALSRNYSTRITARRF
jgi:hypothetical protein